MANNINNTPIVHLWMANTEYNYGDIVVYTEDNNTFFYKCISANNDSSWNSSNWEQITFSETDLSGYVTSSGLETYAYSNKSKQTVTVDGVTVSTGGGSITIDDEMSETSENPVQNKVITNYFGGYATTSDLDLKMDKLNPTGDGSISVGLLTTAIGFSQAFGLTATASGAFSYAAGINAIASGTNSHAEGYGVSDFQGYTVASGMGSYARGQATTASGWIAYAEGFGTSAAGYCSHAEGDCSITTGEGSHAEGGYTRAYGMRSHAEGEGSCAFGDYSHAEGYHTTANGNYSHAEGQDSNTTGAYSHAEGDHTRTYGECSHAEGEASCAFGYYSHAEGYRTTAYGMSSHAEGYRTTANGNYSHASGEGTIANGYQFVCGQYNVPKDYIYGSMYNYVFIIGWGRDDNNRKTIFAVDAKGDLYISGQIHEGYTFTS